MMPKHIIWNYAQAVSYRVNTSSGSKGLISEKWVWAIARGVPLSLIRIHHCLEWIGMMRTTFNFVLNVLIFFSQQFRSSRVCTEDCVVGDLSVKKGMYVLFSVQMLHNNPELWSEPDKFDPERYCIHMPMYVHIICEHRTLHFIYNHISMIWWSILYTLHIR